MYPKGQLPGIGRIYQINGTVFAEGEVHPLVLHRSFIVLVGKVIAAPAASPQSLH